MGRFSNQAGLPGLFDEFYSAVERFIWG